MFNIGENPPSADGNNLNLNLNDFVRKKIHSAIQYFHQLQRLDASKRLQEILSSFDVPRAIDPEVFAKGVKKFIQLANSNPLKVINKNHASGYSRKAVYGNIYSGLHYNNDLVKLWNSSHLNEPIDASHVSTLVPSSWESVMQDGFTTLIYRGQQPAQALDQLLKGPTVIDCGMFTQLSLWFGIRYILGNERFNQYFGRAPFFITQNTYNGIEDSNKPYSGNPLYSFLSKKKQALIPTITVKHLKNSPLYQLKHPGGNYGGENCIVIDNQYYIFDPHLENTQLTDSAVLNLLRHAFNENRVQYDNDRLAIYAERPNEFHPKLFQTFGQLIEMAEKLRDKELTEEQFNNMKQDHSLELVFDLHKFSIWLQAMDVKPEQTEYLPITINLAHIPSELLNVIPFENRTSMDFSKFKQETSQQKELITISKQFCRSIMADQSKLVILTGKAGVGKTASAVCAAKELTARGKRVVWISEVMVKGWADKAESIADLENCGLEIDKLLAKDPDAIFLDDDNLAGFCGNLLLEKIYSWYVKHPGKGLFITSNQPIHFKECYGYQLDKQYHYPPFTEYNSTQYLNWQYKTDLGGASLRSKRDGQSIGAIVSDSCWKIHESNLEHIELIPAFDDEELLPIRQSLHSTGAMGNTYDKLRPIQQRWIHVHENGGSYIHSFEIGGGIRSQYIEPHLTANPKKFENTRCKTIALEIKEYNSVFLGREIDFYSMDQLIRVLNYAHDQGGRRVILINQTSYNNEQLLIQIKTQLPNSECERTWSRLILLLCETEDSIFQYDQFNGYIENVIPENNADNNCEDLNDWPLLFGKKSGRLFGGLTDSELLHDLSPSLLKDNITLKHDEIKNKFSSAFKTRQLNFFKNLRKSRGEKSEVANTQHSKKKENIQNRGAVFEKQLVIYKKETQVIPYEGINSFLAKNFFIYTLTKLICQSKLLQSIEDKAKILALKFNCK